MKPITDRIKQQGFTAFAAYEVMEPVWERINVLVTGPRPMIYVERWLSGGDLKVVPGLGLETRGFRPGAHFHQDDEANNFQIVLTPGINSLGASGWKLDGTEDDAARRFYTDKRDATKIRVEGFGLGGSDMVEITDYNEHGVGYQRSLYFQMDYNEQRAEREAKLLDGLAQVGDWPAKRLTQLAERTRYYKEPALDVEHFLREGDWA